MTKRGNKNGKLANNALTKTAGKRAAGALKKGVSAIDPVQVIKDLSVAYADMQRIAEQEATKRQAIRSAERTTIKRIEAQRELLMGYLDRSFDERRQNFGALFAALDGQIDAGDAAGAASTLGAVVELAKSSPFKGLETLESVRAALEDPETEFEV